MEMVEKKMGDKMYETILSKEDMNDFDEGRIDKRMDKVKQVNDSHANKD